MRLQEAGGAVMDPAGGKFDVMNRRALAGTQGVAQEAASIIAAGPLSPHEPAP